MARLVTIDDDRCPISFNAQILVGRGSAMEGPMGESCGGHARFAERGEIAGCNAVRCRAVAEGCCHTPVLKST
jgi:hypothetical protein